MSRCKCDNLMGNLASFHVACMVVVCVLAPATVHGQLAPMKEAVRVERIDGTSAVGFWAGVEADGSLKIHGAEVAVVIPIGDVMSITFTQRSGVQVSHENNAGDSDTVATSDTSPDAMFFLADGGRLPGAFLGSGSDGVLTTTVLGESVEFSFARLAGMRLTGADGFPKSESLLQSSLADRLPGQDMLITRDAEEPKRLRGRLVTIAADQGSFTLGKRTRTFKTDRIYALVFASGMDRPRTWPMTFELADGSRFSGTIEAGDSDSLMLNTSLGTTTQLPLARLRRVEGNSPRVVYMSDLTPAATLVEGRVHRAWQVAYDRGLTGKPLAIGARRFSKGIGCHSRTELRYELSEPFVTFVAEVGIDNYVRPRGSVVFRLLGNDGAELYSSGLLTGRDEPVLVRVDVRGAKALTLIVDYGDELDIADHAVWGGARLLRP